MILTTPLQYNTQCVNNGVIYRRGGWTIFYMDWLNQRSHCTWRDNVQGTFLLNQWAHKRYKFSLMHYCHSLFVPLLIRSASLNSHLVFSFVNTLRSHHCKSLSPSTPTIVFTTFVTKSHYGHFVQSSGISLDRISL